jgi:hypothetical protein
MTEKELQEVESKITGSGLDPVNDFIKKAKDAARRSVKAAEDLKNGDFNVFEMTADLINDEQLISSASDPLEGALSAAAKSQDPRVAGEAEGLKGSVGKHLKNLLIGNNEAARCRVDGTELDAAVAEARARGEAALEKMFRLVKNVDIEIYNPKTQTLQTKTVHSFNDLKTLLESKISEDVNQLKQATLDHPIMDSTILKKVVEKYHPLLSRTASFNEAQQLPVESLVKYVELIEKKGSAEMSAFKRTLSNEELDIISDAEAFLKQAGGKPEELAKILKKEATDVKNITEKRQQLT